MVDLGPFFLEKSLLEVFGRMKYHKKKEPRNVYIFLLKKVISLRGQFCSTALVIDTFLCQILFCTNAYYKINLLIEITFLSKKNIFLNPFFMQFYTTKIL